jgi:type II secretory ATPase GspE/PulE/Tfp pilus assembly ATPase PilB-like protein
MRWSVFIDAQSLALAWDAVLLGGWMSGAVLSARFSGLAPKWRSWADTLSLLAGPLGWFAHLLPRAWAWVVAARSREPDPAGYEQTANDILAAALVAGASDIHLEAQEKGYVVRFRQFGLMQEHLRCGRRAGEMLVSVYKVFADLNTAERNHLQDGRFRWTDPASGHVLDVRIATSPALAGEKVALRLLNRPASLLHLSKIGLDAEACDSIRRHLRQPEGLVLVAGPTGSGKTSTSYALLQEISGPSVNTVTIEDPVEYALPHATQIGINPKMGVTFETSLRTVLRQDPNIIFVGEMRDPESFRIGVRAAMSGHLVVSTMHARDTVGALTALRNLDIDRQVLAAAVRMLISQRLVRELCPACRVWTAPDADTRGFFSAPHIRVALPERVAGPSAKGCVKCQQGFLGRTGVFEIMRVDSKVRSWVTGGESEHELRSALAAGGFIDMREDACAKIASGRIWVDDAVRALGLFEN